MNKHIQKDKKRRILVKKTENKRIALKAIQKNQIIEPKIRLLATIELTKLKEKYKISPIKVRNRCILTGRSRGVINYLKISRIMIRSLAAQGLLSGIKKNS